MRPGHLSLILPISNQRIHPRRWRPPDGQLASPAVVPWLFGEITPLNPSRFDSLVRTLTIRSARRRLVAAASGLVDRALGVETARILDHAELEFGPEAGGKYVATPWPALIQLWWTLRRLNVGKGDAFIDYGSGKGRALIAAALFPFHRVIGVELSAALNRIAAGNLRATRRFARTTVELVTEDAATYEIPSDVTIVYLYNPFKDEVFVSVLERIAASLAAAPRRITLIYTNPVMHDALIARGWTLTRTIGRTHVYRNNNPPSPVPF
jgi:SAM-dependent methyltransferase